MTEEFVRAVDEVKCDGHGNLLTVVAVVEQAEGRSATTNMINTIFCDGTLTPHARWSRLLYVSKTVVRAIMTGLILETCFNIPNLHAEPAVGSTCRDTPSIEASVPP